MTQPQTDLAYLRSEKAKADPVPTTKAVKPFSSLLIP